MAPVHPELTELHSGLYSPFMRTGRICSWLRNPFGVSESKLRLLVAAVVLWLPLLHISLHECADPAGHAQTVCSAGSSADGTGVHTHSVECPICSLHLGESLHVSRAATDLVLDPSATALPLTEEMAASRTLLDVTQPRAPPVNSSALL
jgi:hypothetical protein